MVANHWQEGYATAGNEGSEEHPAKQTLASTVYTRIRNDILNGLLKDGAKVRVDWLAGHYGVGASPVREALTRLFTEGLLDHHVQRGFSVKPVTATELEELARTRCWIEEIGLRRSIANRNWRWEEQVVLALHRLARASSQVQEEPSSPDQECERERLHGAFHQSLMVGCGSQWLVRFSGQLAAQLRRYRVLTKSNETSLRDCMTEHRLIAEAAIDGEADRAVAALMSHYERSAAACMATFR